MTVPHPCTRCGAPRSSADDPCSACLMRGALTAAAAPQTLDDQTQGILSPEELAGRFPGYTIESLLGSGGMGAVYRAKQTKLDRQVAIKVLRPVLEADPLFAVRFEQEARALAKLDHPGVVRIYDFGDADGLFYLVMEHVEGASLRDLMQSGRLTARDVLTFAPQICDALQAAHDVGIVHRDIKPENILVNLQGQARIADFGLAKIASSESQGMGLTATDQVLGTLHYMAPEQMQADRSLDHRADLYSLGVVLYEMLTGDLPVGRFHPPSTKAGQESKPLDPVVMRALENEPDKRYQSAEDVKKDIVSGPSPGSGATIRKTPARRRLRTAKRRETRTKGKDQGKPQRVVSTQLAPKAPQTPSASPSAPSGDLDGWAWARFIAVFACLFLPMCFLRHPSSQIPNVFDKGVVSATGWNVSIGSLPIWLLAAVSFCTAVFRSPLICDFELTRALATGLDLFGFVITLTVLVYFVAQPRAAPGPGAFLLSLVFTSAVVQDLLSYLSRKPS